MPEPNWLVVQWEALRGDGQGHLWALKEWDSRESDEETGTQANAEGNRRTKMACVWKR